MKSRIEKMIGDISKDMWIGTFHSICVRILRKYIDRLGFNSSFAIFDALDQKNLIKQILKKIDLDDKTFSDKSVLSEISNAKNEMINETQYKLNNEGEYRKSKIAEVYNLYQKSLKQNNALDFDDIINYTIEILMNNDDALQYYSEKFKYILVDEYQDTNKAQFTLISLLAARNGNITVVGDNDQGIYSFRGADIKNILNFEKDFPGTKVIKLEQNYRSTSNILNTANSVIKNNQKKYEKKLWTEKEEGTNPTLYISENEYDEANYIVKEIEYLKREEYLKYSDFVILYRINAQSRSIEDILRRENIPYQIIGGQKFYERKEIKDIIAYLRLIQNQSDNFSLKRIINEPKRGIGKTSIEKIEQIADENEISMYEVIKHADEYGLNKVYINAKDFIQTIEELNAKKETLIVSEMIKNIIDKIKYIEYLKNEEPMIYENRIENIEEFLGVAMEFEEEYVDNSLVEFLESITLSSDIDNLADDGQKVTLMTLHSAKGLEYEVVFLVGMEEGIFPGYRSIENQKDIEEERRLCYVGITRAKQHLYLICAKQRTIFGSTQCNRISRFIQEIPKEYLQGSENINKYFAGGNQETKENEENKRIFSDTEKSFQTGKKEYNNQFSNLNNYNNINNFKFRTAESFLNSLKNKNKENNLDLSKYKVKQKVFHPKFGQGIIEKIEEEGTDLKLDINFEKVGKKRLMAKYAGLEIIS